MRARTLRADINFSSQGQRSR